jgi:hypothetical protein
VHTITLKAIDPNKVEHSRSILINRLAPGTVQLSVSKDARENVLVSWSVPSPELIDVIEIYRTQYNFISGSNSYYPEPWDTIRLKPGNGTSYYDNLIPFTDKAVYSMKAFTKEGYWSKNVADTTIDGSKRFPLHLSGGHDWNVSSVEAISMASEKVVYIRNGSRITAFNFESMSLVRNIDMGFPVNYFHAGDHGSGPELFVANNQKLEIYNLDFQKKTEIETNYRIDGIEGKGNLLFLFANNWLNRTTLSTTNNLPLAFRFRVLDDGLSLIAISYSTTPTDMKYIDFKADLNHPRIVDDKYHGTYPLASSLFEVIPKQNHVITSWFGSIYTADENMQFVGNLSDV